MRDQAMRSLLQSVIQIGCCEGRAKDAVDSCVTRSYEEVVKTMSSL